MNSILSSTLYNNYTNYSSPIPDNFDWKLYAAIVKDPTINSSSSAYKHYKHKCTVNSHNYRLYWRTYYKIPNNFVEESYKKYLNFSSIKFQFNNFEDLYKFYITKGIEMYPLNDQYSRIHFEIPDDFDAKIYITVYPEAKKENDNQIYHFYHYNKESFPLNAYYYRLKYDIPDDFDISVYNERYNFNYNESNAYQFFKNIGKASYPLDSKYYAIKYNIPDDFNIQIYNQRYNFNYNESNGYQFFNNIGQYSYPLDLEYYNLKNKTVFNRKYKNNIPNGNFDNQRHNTKIINTDNFNDSNITNLDGNNLASDNLASDNLDDNNLDDNNLASNSLDDNSSHGNNLDSNLDDNDVRTILKIPQDFNYENYNLRYQLNLNEIQSYKYFKTNGKKHSLDEAYYRIQYNTPSELTCKYLESYKKLYPNTIKNNASIQDVFKYYNDSIINIKNKKQNLNIISDERYDYILDLIDPEVIFKDEVFFYDFIKCNIQLKHIYQIYLDNPDSEIGIKFIHNYEYLENYKEYICNEESKRTYFLLNDFIEEYFSKSNILIEEKSYFLEKKTIQKTRTNIKKRIGNTPFLADTNIDNNNINKNMLIQMFNTMKEKSLNNFEEYEEEEIYYEDINYFPIIKIPLYTTFFSNLEKENKKYTFKELYCIIQKCQNFYNIFKQQKTIIEKFKNYKLSSPDDTYCAVVFMNDNYLHNYLSILNNLMYLSKVSNLYIFINKNIENTKQFLFYYDLISSKININKIYLDNNFTFNDFNNFMLNTSFWNNFNSEYIILFSTLTFLKNDLFFNDIDISNFNTFYVSNYINKNNYKACNLFSIRSKKYILETLKELNMEFNKEEDLINKNIKQINYTLNIDKHIETFLLQNFINNNILSNYLVNMENSFYYLDLEYKLIDNIQNMR